MEQQVRVEIVPRTVEAGDTDQQAFHESAARLGQVAYSARVNGAEFPVEVFGVEPVDGRVLVSLVVDASSVQIGDPSTIGQPGTRTAPQVKPEKAPSVWGAPGPDPREGMPGWQRPVSADVAGNVVGRLV